MEFRIKQVRARQNLPDAAARQFIEEIDKARSRRLMAMFGTDWRDPGQYDCVLNMARMSSAAAEKIIARAALLEDYQPTDASRRALSDLALATKIEAALLQFPGMRDVAVKVEAKDGAVPLSGLIPVSVSVEQITRRIEMMPEVKVVNSDLVNIPSRALGYS